MSQHPVEVLFDRARSIDEHLGSMSDTRERAVAGLTSGLIGEGEEVTWEARHFGVLMRLSSRVTELAYPTRFVDEQVAGPFRSFRHEHVFSAVGVGAGDAGPAGGVGGGSMMVDRVEFRAPFGVLGLIAERVVLRRYLRRLLEERGRYLAA